MTDKKKIDEAAILNVTSSQGGMSAETTFVADDALALAQLLKSAGVTSQQFNGPATLSVEVQQGTGSMTSRVTAPDLRSIMTLLEPEFQSAGDMEADMEVDMEPELDGMDMGDAEAQAVQDTDDAIGMVANPENYEVVDDLESGVEIYDPGMGPDSMEPKIDDLDGEIEEEADYDYRTTDIDAQEYPGVADKAIVQPKTHAVPARSGDNPLDEAVGNESQFTSYIEDAYGAEHEVQVYYEADSGEFDTGLDYPSTSSHGSTVSLVSVTRVSDGIDILDTLTSDQNQYLEGQAIEDYEAMEPYMPESISSRSFMDYVQEAKSKNAPVMESRIEKAKKEITVESLMDEFRLDELSVDAVNSYINRAGDTRPAGKALALKKKWGNKDFGFEEPRVKARWGHEVDEEAELDEAPRGGDYASKSRQYGQPFYLNTDCGYASLQDLGAHDYFHDGGATIIEIDRNGKKGLNFVSSHDNTPPGTPITCVTQTRDGQKYRPGKVIDSFTGDEYHNDRAGLEARLAKHGISPTKKLSVKTFD